MSVPIIWVESGGRAAFVSAALPFNMVLPHQDLMDKDLTMGDVHTFTPRPDAPGSKALTVPETWVLFSQGLQHCRDVLDEAVVLIKAGGDPADIFAKIDDLNATIAFCGPAATFLREAGGRPPVPEGSQ